jgi:hypothetical protein
MRKKRIWCDICDQECRARSVFKAGRFCHEHVDWEPAHRPASSTEAQEWARSCKR